MECSELKTSSSGMIANNSDPDIYIRELSRHHAFNAYYDLKHQHTLGNADRPLICLSQNMPTQCLLADWTIGHMAPKTQCCHATSHARTACCTHWRPSMQPHSRTILLLVLVPQQVSQICRGQTATPLGRASGVSIKPCLLSYSEEG
jgi:hypothetical protein